MYNCFELTDIQHRGLMRSKLDFLIAVAWNPDISYYSNIIEAATRDLHCYVINVNTSQFGDSRIAVPKKAYRMNVVRVKGGINTVIIKEKLKIAELRSFQVKKRHKDEDETYKPQPAGYSFEDARERATHRIDDRAIIIEKIHAQ